MRASRLVGLLSLLQARGRMTAAQLAAELEVSQRTILRDIEALSSAGFPVYAIRGSLGGFELLAGFTAALPAGHAQRRAGPSDPRGRRARIRLSPLGRRIAALTGRPPGLRVRRSAAAVAERDGWVEAWMPIETADAAISDVLALGGEAELLHPPELRRRMRAVAAQIAELHS
jgi:predicted DNA-binding transcriptional regulator YafY